MKNQKKKLSLAGLFFATVMAMMIASVFGTAIVAAPGIADVLTPQLQSLITPAVFAGVMTLMIIPHTSLPYFLSAVQVEVWQNTVEENLFKDNEFLLRSRNDNQYILGAKVVHIPQAASPSAVVKNRSVLPATVTKRSDTDVTYVMDEYTTDPRLIPSADTFELSYDKRKSVVSDDTQALSEVMADDTLIKWAPDHTVDASNFISATGTAKTAWITGMTGTRHTMTLADLRSAKKRLDVSLAPKAGRCILLDPDMEQDLLKDLDANQTAAYQAAYDIRTGVSGRLLGFDIYVRSTVLVYSSANVVNAYGQAVAASDVPAGLFWCDSRIALARIGVQMFQDMNNPLYYGDIYSFLVRAGGRIIRADGNGVGVITFGS